MTFQKIVLYLGAGFFLVYGLGFVLVPEALSLLVTGSAPQGVSVLVDYRATYGGMTVAVGLLMVYLERSNEIQKSLVILIIVLMCMAASRALGMLLDGAGNQLMSIYLLLELAGSALAYLALRQDRIS